MNIEQYRAMKAQEEAQKDSTTKEQPTDAQTVTTPNADVQATQKEDTKGDSTSGKETKSSEDGKEQAQTVVDQTKKDETKPDTIEIDGKQVTLDELKNGYLRQTDYTKKTQDVARQRKEAQQALELFNAIKENPQLAQQLSKDGVLPNIDPAQQRIVELENKYYDLVLEREVEQLQAKYPDFEVREVLQVAQEKSMTNLEDAYLLAKSRKQSSTPPPQEVNVDQIKEQLRQELLQEIQQQNADTSSIIRSGGDTKPIVDDSPKLSNAEIRIAQNMGMTPTDYAKWRDAPNKRK